MISGDDLLHQFLNVNYEVEQRLQWAPLPTQPLTFFDRHISTGLRLNSIKRAPWITKALTEICEETIRDFAAAGHYFIGSQDYRLRMSTYPLTETRSDSVANYHFAIISRRCNAFASRLLFNPDDPQWFSFLAPGFDRREHSFYQCGGIDIKETKETDLSKEDFSVPPETLQSLADWVIPTVVKLNQSPWIVNHEFYVNNKQAQDLLEKMGPCSEFSWEHSMTSGASAIPASERPLDSQFMKTLFPAMRPSGLHDKTLAKGAIPTRTPNKRRKVFPPIQRTVRRERPYRMNANHYIQMAWTNAVEKDVTFIVFNCGRSERIGIRHRETQTLYLSDLIDPTCMKGYGQIHLGLLIAALKDRLDKLNLVEEPKAPVRKRPRESIRSLRDNGMKDKATRRKRRKLSPDPELTSPTSVELDRKIFGAELANRDLILLYLNSGIHQSPAPSSFRRIEPSCAIKPFNNRSDYHFKRKLAYPPEGCISVIANKPRLGYGSVGLVYRVLVEIDMDSGSKHQRELIMKLAIGIKKERLVEEYSFYKRLAAAGVTNGIIDVHGLFLDMETGGMLMMMEDAGTSLRTRDIERGLEPSDCAETTDEERAAFVNVLEGIHSAGILHNDLRIDNLTIKENGEVCIIDFDLSEHGIWDIELYEIDMKVILANIGWGVDSDSDDE